MKSIYKWIAFLLVFTLLAVGFTYVCIRRSLGEPLLPHKEEVVEIVPEAGIDMNGTYDQNDLILLEVEETEGDARLTYLQIDGLKNAEVEGAVNAALLAEADALKAHFSENGAAINYMTYQVYGNFSNVLSVGLFAGDVNYQYESRYLSFDLNDGSLLQLEDLFGAQADLTGIVRAAFYEAVTRGTLTDYYWEELQSPDEQEVYEVVKYYLAGERSFFFTPTEIYFIYDTYNSHISMLSYAEDITVYHKYISEESLFERDDIGFENIFTCAEIPEGYDRRVFGYLEENLWYDIGVSQPYFGSHVDEAMQQQVLGFVDGKYAECMEEVEALRKLAQENPHQMYILFVNPYFNIYSSSEYVDGFWENTPSKAVSYMEYYKLYTMPKSLYDSKYHDRLVAEYRNSPHYVVLSGMENAIDNDVSETKHEIEELYRYDTGELLSVESLFVDGYDYEKAIHDYVIDHLVRYDGYLRDDAPEVAENMKYTLAGEGLRIKVPALQIGGEIWMALSEFDSGVLKIFE